MRAWRIWLRSAPGQLSLFAATFVAAVVLAGVIVGLRGVLFEPYVREVYPPLDGWSEQAARELAAALTRSRRVTQLGEELQERIDRATDPARSYQDLERIYGAWISDENLDRDGHLPRRLTKLQPDWVMQRLRRTLAVGRPNQCGRAIAWLDAIADESATGGESRQLAEYARRRAKARGEADLERLAESVVGKGRPHHGDR